MKQCFREPSSEIFDAARFLDERMGLRYQGVQTDEIAVSHLLQRAQKLRHNNFAAEQRR